VRQQQIPLKLVHVPPANTSARLCER
jgi:hypothetical protein